MLDGLSLDQLRTFIAAADTGSFSAAGRRLGRAQSVVSQTLANLEAQIGVKLFARTGRYPVLTPEGRALLNDARVVAQSVDRLKARARGLVGGLEPEVSLAVNVLFPTAVLTQAVAGFQSAFPATPLRLGVEGMGGVIEPVVERRCAIGIRGPLAVDHPDLTGEPLLAVRYLMVAAPGHPLARHPGPIGQSMLADHVQLVLSDRTRLTEGRDLRVFARRTWRLTDLGAKHAFLRAGLGWGGMPHHVVEEDLASGALVPLVIADEEPAASIAMTAIYRTDTPPGPAGRWLIEALKQASQAVGEGASAASRLPGAGEVVR